MSEEEPAGSETTPTGEGDRLATPCLLIASPQMGDPFFERTVILLWHHDHEGAAGLVINRPIPHPLSEVLDGADDYAGAEVVWGGPVERTRGSVVARTDVGEEEGWVLRPGLSVTTSATTLEQLYTSHQPLLLCLGYAGWGAGQLDQEIEIGSWLFADASDELIFDTPREALYDSALASLGLTPGTIIMNPVEA